MLRVHAVDRDKSQLDDCLWLTVECFHRSIRLHIPRTGSERPFRIIGELPSQLDPPQIRAQLPTDTGHAQQLRNFRIGQVLRLVFLLLLFWFDFLEMRARTRWSRPLLLLSLTRCRPYLRLRSLLWSRRRCSSGSYKCG